MFLTKLANGFGVLGLLLLATVPGKALPIYAVNSTGSLLLFDSASPGTIVANNPITGLQIGESLLGIDFRPANSLLYGIGSTGRVYTINTANGQSTQVGLSGQFSPAGTSFGVDFNPVPDRIRFTSNTGQNLRLNPNDGTLSATDGTLAYRPGDASFGQNPNIVGSAYTNSFAGATTTTLYGIDSILGILVIQNPPNVGTLNTVGSLGVSTTGNVGFDIAFPGNIGFAALQEVGGSSSLYTINLTTGAAALIGSIGQKQVITGLAIAAVPEPGTIILMGFGIAAFAFRRRLSLNSR